ncbi:bacteriocin fulvocin C-related protein [Flavobacterium sp. JAS]|uniref:bacteriocin fulvocin C-related protein n=1 Tax=Flavobacterium sp. JAS TaxID=2897329 RepID=UPI001E5DDDF9|nr:bacteriocin fulvocin C-related protein [Flavobacterium sp. JAS]MCD0472629.1 bacteriocin fulvocin C-related protein [Flavobacterium sp. JAS]
MKQFLTKNLILTLTICLMTSCSEDSTVESLPVSIKSQLKISKVLGEKNEENQKIAYVLLSSEEKYSLWSNKYDELLNDRTHLKSQGIILNDEQQELIEELKNKITKKIFEDKDSDEKAYFKNIYTPDFLKRAKKDFTKEQLGIIFFKLSAPNSNTTLKQLSTSRIANSEENCDCNIGAIFTCQWGADRCNEASCEIKSNACGFLGLWECNGMCAF